VIQFSASVHSFLSPFLFPVYVSVVLGDAFAAFPSRVACCRGWGPVCGLILCNRISIQLQLVFLGTANLTLSYTVPNQVRCRPIVGQWTLS
jgi:hypothetical protein